MIGKMIYDIAKDELKEATQEDVDNMWKALQTSSKMVRILRNLVPGLVPPSGPNFLKELDAALVACIERENLSS